MVVLVGCWLPLRWNMEPRLFVPHMAIPMLHCIALHEFVCAFYTRPNIQQQRKWDFIWMGILTRRLCCKQLSISKVYEIG
jgi:hypothetical protein